MALPGGLNPEDRMGKPSESDAGGALAGVLACFAAADRLWGNPWTSDQVVEMSLVECNHSGCTAR